MDGMETVKVYEQYGVAALFIFLFVTVLSILIYVLVNNARNERKRAQEEKRKDEARLQFEIERTNKMATIVEKCADHLARHNDLAIQMTHKIEEDTHQQRELLNYLRIRDNARPGG